jgi:hypothetical protein
LSDNNREAKRVKEKPEKPRVDDNSSSSDTTDPLENSPYRTAARISERAAENLHKIDAQQQQQKRITEEPKQNSNSKENTDTSQNG